MAGFLKMIACTASVKLLRAAPRTVKITEAVPSICSRHELKERILHLGNLAQDQKKQIRLTVAELKSSVQPRQLLRQTVETVMHTRRSHPLVKSVGGLFAGWLGTKILFKKKKGLMGSLWSSGVQIFLSRIISRSVNLNKVWSVLVKSK